MNLSLLLKEASQSENGITFFESREKTQFYSYSELWKLSNQYAHQLKKKGVRQGDKIVIMLPSNCEFIVQFFACLQLGAIPSAIYPPVRLGRVDDWKTTVLAQIDSISPVMILTDSLIMPFLGNDEFYSRFSLGINVLKPSHDRLEELENSDMAFIQFSSGTTGLPKPVVLSHNSVLSNIEMITKTLPISDKGHCCCSWLPLYHDMGLVGALLSSIHQKVSLILIRPEQFLARPYLWFQAISDYKATITIAPNFAFGLCTKKIKNEQITDIDLSTLKITLCGAETVHPQTLIDFSNKFSNIGFDQKSILPVYGMAEATLAVTFHDGHSAPRWSSFDKDSLEIKGIAIESPNGISLACVGRCLEGVELQITDSENNGVADRIVGDIRIKSPSLFSSIGFEEETKNPIWYHSGDRGFIIDGQLYLVGRKKDIIIHRGRNIDPTQIERIVDDVQNVRKGCSAAVSDYSYELGSERIIIFVESDDNIESETQKLVKARLGLDSLVIVLKPGTIYRTSSGKIQRQKTFSEWKSGELKSSQTFIPKIIAQRAKGAIYNWYQSHVVRK